MKKEKQKESLSGTQNKAELSSVYTLPEEKRRRRRREEKRREEKRRRSGGQSS